MAASRVASMVNAHPVLATDAGLHSLIYECWELCRGLEVTHILGNEDARRKITRFHPYSPQSRRDHGYRLFLYQNKTMLTSSGQKTIVVFDLNFANDNRQMLGTTCLKYSCFRP